jgi:hypothetical protein
MLTRAFATLTLMLALNGGVAPTGPAAPGHLDRARVARRAQLVDDTEGCRVPPPSPDPVAPAACTEEGQP